MGWDGMKWSCECGENGIKIATSYKIIKIMMIIIALFHIYIITVPGYAEAQNRRFKRNQDLFV